MFYWVTPTHTPSTPQNSNSTPKNLIVRPFGITIWFWTRTKLNQRMLWGSSNTPGGFSIGKNHKCWKHHTQFKIGVTVTPVTVITTLLYSTNSEVFIKWMILIECMTKYRTPSSDKLVEQLIQHLKNSGVRCDTVHNFNSVYAKRTTRTRRWFVDTGFAGDSGIQNTVSTHTRYNIGITRTDCQYPEPDRQDTPTVG